MKQQPGVMLYFDVRESIAQLSYEEKGMLLDAILDYGQKRQEPDFADRTLTLIWPFVRKDIHRDSERYKERQAAGKKGAQRRWGEEEVSDSKPMANDSNHMAKIPPTPTPSPTSSAAAAPPTAAAASETTPPAAPPLPRTNGSALPDLVARYLPGQRSTPEEIDRRRADAIARLRAMPGS